MTFKKSDYFSSEVIRSFAKVAREKGIIKEENIEKTASPKQDFKVTNNLSLDLIKLCDGLKSMGLTSYASELESNFSNYKITQQSVQDLIDSAHPDGSVTISGVDAENAVIESLVDKQLKMLELVKKKPSDGLSVIAQVQYSPYVQEKFRALEIKVKTYIQSLQSSLASCKKLTEGMTSAGMKAYTEYLTKVSRFVNANISALTIMWENMLNDKAFDGISIEKYTKNTILQHCTTEDDLDNEYKRIIGELLKVRKVIEESRKKTAALLINKIASDETNIYFSTFKNKLINIINACEQFKGSSGNRDISSQEFDILSPTSWISKEKTFAWADNIIQFSKIFLDLSDTSKLQINSIVEYKSRLRRFITVIKNSQDPSGLSYISTVLETINSASELEKMLRSENSKLLSPNKVSGTLTLEEENATALKYRLNEVSSSLSNANVKLREYLIKATKEEMSDGIIYINKIINTLKNYISNIQMIINNIDTDPQYDGVGIEKYTNRTSFSSFKTRNDLSSQLAKILNKKNNILSTVDGWFE